MAIDATSPRPEYQSLMSLSPNETDIKPKSPVIKKVEEIHSGITDVQTRLTSIEMTEEIVDIRGRLTAIGENVKTLQVMVSFDLENQNTTHVQEETVYSDDEEAETQETQTITSQQIRNRGCCIGLMLTAFVTGTIVLASLTSKG